MEMARTCDRTMQLGFPMLVDGIDDAVGQAYAAWPDRLYLVDLDGTVVYRSDPGPFGFRPDELEVVIEELVAFSSGQAR
jgi:type I thyroxine 5'-deiodinase